MPSHFGFSRQLRLLDADAFTAVFEKGKRHNLAAGLYIVLRREQAPARLGLVVAKKRLAKAVKRNHLKRSQRENFRLSQAALVACDIVFLANHRLAQLTRAQMAAYCVKDWQKLTAIYAAVSVNP